MKGKVFLHLFVACLASASASEPIDPGCEQKNWFSVFNLLSESESPVPVRGNCEETGLGWIGKPIGSKDDIFFTNWTEFFLQLECVDRLEVHIEDDYGKRLFQNLTTTNLEGQNPVLTIDQSEELICNVGKPFQSTLVVYSRGNHP